MEILVTTFGTSAAGIPRREERRIAGTVFGVGRGTQCQIQLPDARVALLHASIQVGESGATIEAKPGRIVHNDREVAGARLVPGDHIEVGPYLLTVEPPPDGVALALSVRLSKRISTRGRAALYRVLMRAPRLSIRRLSYIGFFGVLLLFLLAPIATDLSGNGNLHALSAGLVQAWNPGPLARGHQTFAHECRACHEIAFIQVRDHACMTCHRGVREHVPRSPLLKASFQDMTCAGCHRDHKGRAMAPRSQQLCAGCHADIRRTNPQARSANASDFAAGHPEFRLSLVDADQPKEIRRMRPEPSSLPIAERSNLKFNHTLHLDPRGVRDPKGRRVLGCESCHQPEPGGARMAPVAMDKHCRDCHALTFEPQVTQRQVPHGPVAEVRTMLREFYARLALGDVPGDVRPPGDVPRLRPGAALAAEERREAMRIADEKTQRVLRELMQTRAVCSTCHHVSRSSEGEWQVAPVALTAAWMPAATFTHAKHTAQACITCHDVRSSRRAEDVAMPGIARCRECHGGAAPAPGRVASDCATCHRFHGGRDLWHGARS